MGSKEQKVFAVGIDLGTTFSSVCYIDEKMTPRMIQNYEGKNQTPSCVSFENNYTFVGDEAEERRHTHAPSTFYQVKRFIGKRKGDKVENEKWPFEVLQDAKKNLAFRVDDELMYPEQISALVLSKMKAIAEKYLRAAVTEAVITVPAHFDDLQRKATKRAAEIVGLKVLNILNEPTAAAIGYGYISASADSTRKRTILVYDLGGGTFDVSIVKMEGDRKAEVIASEGIMDLGGEDFDRLLFEEVTMQVADDNQQIKDSWEVLKKCREAKVKLSNAELAEIFITVQPNNEQKKIVFTRKLFNELCGGEIDKTMACVKEALKKAKIGKDDIDEVVMVGGSSRILYAQEMIQKFFEKKKLRCDTNIDETVSMGAAIMAHAMASDGERIILEDIVPFSLGVGVKNGIFDVIIPAYSKLGVEYKKVYQNAEDNQRQIIIKVYQGEAKTVAENKLLAELAIQLVPGKHGIHKLEETFFVQPDGILKVTAKLLSTNEVKILEIKDVKNDQRTVEQLREKHIRRIARDEAEFERRCALNELDQAVRSLRRKAMRHTDAAEKSRLSKASTNESKWMQEHPTADIDTIQKRLQAINSYLK